MTQLEFPFMASRYDITTDSKVPVTQEYVDLLEEVHQAYTRVRLAAQRAGVVGVPVVTLSALDAIHSDLRKRISVST